MACGFKRVIAGGQGSRRMCGKKGTRGRTAPARDVVRRGSAIQLRRWRMPRCYPRIGGACERRLRCRTNSVNPSRFGGGSALDSDTHPVGRNSIAATIHATGSGRLSVIDAPGAFTPSGTRTLSAWQHPALRPSTGARSGCGRFFSQHSCCTAAACFAFSIWPNAHRCESANHPSSIATISEMRKMWFVRSGVTTEYE